MPAEHALRQIDVIATLRLAPIEANLLGFSASQQHVHISHKDTLHAGKVTLGRRSPCAAIEVRSKGSEDRKQEEEQKQEDCSVGNGESAHRHKPLVLVAQLGHEDERQQDSSPHLSSAQERHRILHLGCRHVLHTRHHRASRLCIHAGHGGACTYETISTIPMCRSNIRITFNLKET